MPPHKLDVAAHVIRDDAEAIRIAHGLAENFAREASIRDRERRLPLKELDEFSQSGLWGINVPREYGGAEVSYLTIAEVIKIVSAADPSIGQIPQNHLAVLDIIRLSADEDQKRFFFGEALRGVRLGNAFAESGSKNAGDFQTRIARGADGFELNGRKFYCSGALLAHRVLFRDGTDGAGAMVRRAGLGARGRVRADACDAQIPRSVRGSNCARAEDGCRPASAYLM